MNTVHIKGRMTRDPEQRTFESGAINSRFTLAVDRRFKGKDGEKVTDFIDVVAWSKTSEFVQKFFSKGKEAIVVGRLESHKSVQDDGTSRTYWEVVADQVEFCGSKGDATNNNAAGAPSGFVPAETGFTEVSEEDMPF